MNLNASEKHGAFGENASCILMALKLFSEVDGEEGEGEGTAKGKT